MFLRIFVILVDYGDQCVPGDSLWLTAGELTIGVLLSFFGVA
jgi:hypothetical protein